MSRHSQLLLGVDTVTKTIRGIVMDCIVFGDAAETLGVKLLVPTDGSSPQILRHTARIGGPSGHEILEFCAHAVDHAHRWLNRHRLLEKHDLTSADDWHFDGPFCDQRYAFRSPSLNVLATFDSTSGAFESFVGCMVRQGRVYRHSSKRLGAPLFAKVVMTAAMRTAAPTPGGPRS